MPSLHDATRGRILYGGDYNPEQWPEEVWPEDIALMRRAGVTTATVGVFSWARLEPRPGARDFGWLDRVLDLLHGGGIDACLATPTASPPPWLGERHPETLPVTADGTTLWWGSRNQYCPSSAAYRDHAHALVEDLAARYAGHPALRIWHISNELGPVCHCAETSARFRDWLRRRYGDLDGLNHAWGTAFWSQAHSDWSTVTAPRSAPYLPNPAQTLDFQRFSSDVLLECFTAERDILRRHTPDVPVTTNFMALYKGIDSWAFAAAEDAVSLDLYPDPADPRAAAFAAVNHDLTRSLAGGPWMVMEQAASAVNWRPVNRPKPEGLLRLQSLQSVARGADALLFFQWRASRSGAEKFHSAMVPHAGPDSPGHRRIRALGAELRLLGEAVGTDVRADIAVLHDWHSWWALEQPGRPSARITAPELLYAWHGALWDEHLTADFAHPEADLSRYRLVAVPTLYLASDAAVDNLVRYVHGGGTLVTGFFSGIADPTDTLRPGGMDARLRALLGVHPQEWWPLDDGATVRCDSAALGPFTGTLWSEDLRTDPGTETVAALNGGDLDGTPAVTRTTAGAGTAWYLATLPEPPALRGLLADAARRAGVHPVLPGLPDGVEAVRRGGLLFLLNHGERQTEVPVQGRYRELLTNRSTEGTLRLPRYGAAVLRPETTAE
ncbi:beta-galactosidase [Peterkaempfera bronchialis]|uniref:beta-galactosidase n=1 Tax=Peterkaempfera bronchialis TaxID=2126346 RepID=UPI003C2EE55A